MSGPEEIFTIETKRKWDEQRLRIKKLLEVRNKGLGGKSPCKKRYLT